MMETVYSTIYYGATKAKRTQLLEALQRLFEASGKQTICVPMGEMYGLWTALQQYGNQNEDDAFGGSKIDLLVTAGQTLAQSQNTLYILVGEAQNCLISELGQLSMAIHRCNQLGLPIVLICVGTSSILRKIGKASDYAEYLYRFINLDTARFANLKCQ